MYIYLLHYLYRFKINHLEDIIKQRFLVRIRYSINEIIIINISLDKEELEEIVTKGRAPSPVLEMPPQYAIHHQPQITETYIPNHITSSKMNVSVRDSHPQYPTYSSTQPSNTNNVNFDFQNFYGPVS